MNNLGLVTNIGMALMSLTMPTLVASQVVSSGTDQPISFR
jgi:hypothetical protein